MGAARCGAGAAAVAAAAAAAVAAPCCCAALGPGPSSLRSLPLSPPRAQHVMDPIEGKLEALINECDAVKVFVDTADAILVAPSMRPAYRSQGIANPEAKVAARPDLLCPGVLSLRQAAMKCA